MSAAAMIDDELLEWRQRLRQRSAEVVRWRQERAVARRRAARRRAYGLVDRRAARLAGPLPPGYEPDLDCTE
jgi:hypothetical protein